MTDEKIGTKLVLQRFLCQNRERNHGFENHHTMNANILLQIVNQTL